MTLEEESEDEELGAWRRSPVAQRVWEGGAVTWSVGAPRGEEAKE
jgi:hypothetical protein